MNLDGIQYVFYLAGLAIILIIGGIGYVGYKIYDNNFNDEIIKSKVMIQPTYEIITDGKKVDTTFVYTFKK